MFATDTIAIVGWVSLSLNPTQQLLLLGVAQRVAEGFRDLNPTYDVNCGM